MFESVLPESDCLCPANAPAINTRSRHVCVTSENVDTDLQQFINHDDFPPVAGRLGTEPQSAIDLDLTSSWVSTPNVLPVYYKLVFPQSIQVISTKALQIKMIS